MQEIKAFLQGGQQNFLSKVMEKITPNMLKPLRKEHSVAGNQTSINQRNLFDFKRNLIIFSVILENEEEFLPLKEMQNTIAESEAGTIAHEIYLGRPNDTFVSHHTFF